VREPYTELYVHLVWATWDRLPLVTPMMEERVYGALKAKSRELGCEPIAVGGMPDHVHVLVRLNPVLAISKLVGELKGATSHMVTHEINPDDFFKWQGAYGAFTLRKSDVATVKNYIMNQKTHHSDQTMDIDRELLALQ